MTNLGQKLHSNHRMLPVYQRSAKFQKAIGKAMLALTCRPVEEAAYQIVSQVDVRVRNWCLLAVFGLGSTGAFSPAFPWGAGEASVLVFALVKILLGVVESYLVHRQFFLGFVDLGDRLSTLTSKIGSAFLPPAYRLVDELAPLAVQLSTCFKSIVQRFFVVAQRLCMALVLPWVFWAAISCSIFN